jgi:hypothetical protein
VRPIPIPIRQLGRIMPIWSHCKMDMLDYDRTPADEDYPREVRINQHTIVVENEDNEGTVWYVGVDDGTGHLELHCRERAGRATLHMFQKGLVLEGYWEEGGYRGLWRICLEE